MCFVMELCQGGDLLSYVRKRRKLKEDNAKYLYNYIFEKQPTKYKVGSSTSFRACLTMCCVNNVIGKYHSKLVK